MIFSEMHSIIRKWGVIFGFFGSVGIILWLFFLLNADSMNEQVANIPAHVPDSYMKNFSVMEMDPDGIPKHRLHGDHQVHYTDDITEVVRPKLEIFQHDTPPIVVVADHGEFTSVNEVILLRDHVNFKKYNAANELELEIITTDVRVFLEQEYVETDSPARLITKQSTIDSIGIKINFEEERLELAQHILTKIKSRNIDE